MSKAKKTIIIVAAVLVLILIITDAVLFSGTGEMASYAVKHGSSWLAHSEKYLFGESLYLMTMGKMVAVSIQWDAPDFFYKILLLKLKLYKTFNSSVRNVYMNELGCITVDCRTAY